MIIDAHAHVFPGINGSTGRGPVRSLGFGRISVGDEEMVLMPPLSADLVFTPEILLANLDWAGVAHVVLLQGPFYGPCNDYAVEAAKRYPTRISSVAYLNPWADDVETQWRQVRDNGHYLGIKIEFSVPTGLSGLHPGARLDDPKLDFLWQGLEDAGMTLTLDLGGIGSESYQTDAVRKITEGHPNLQVIIAHLGQPSLAMEDDKELLRQWYEQVDLGLLPNLAFDCAAHAHYLQRHETYPFPTAAKWLRMGLDRVGAQKIMWGTDVPALLSVLSYPQLLQMGKEHLAFLPENEQADVLGNNARRIYKLKI